MHAFLNKLGLSKKNPGVFFGKWKASGAWVEKRSPIDGKVLASVQEATPQDYERTVHQALEAFLKWRNVPAPVRGQTVRALGEELRRNKKDLGRLVTLETGKILQEGEGEVQEMIDICDFAVGLSRQLYGLTIASERASHRLMEQWHPLGLVGVITAFNFPVAVWAWNSALASVCGDPVLWKPSNKTPLTAIAVTRLAEKVCRQTGADPAIFSLVIGDVPTVAEKMTHDRRIPLISATGSCAMGFQVARAVHGRLGRTLLELGGNNGVVVAPSADLELATRAILFGAVGTAGQRCTSTRRVIAHESIYSALKRKLLEAYKKVPIGNPLKEGTLMGPLIDEAAVIQLEKAIEALKAEGGKILYGGERLSGSQFRGGCYVTPCLAEAKSDMSIVCEETFGPLFYLMSYKRWEDALQMHNNVPQGLSSAIFTCNQREAEEFISVAGSDCGIANINAGTSGAEIGGAFGGEKDTGGGRESGSDSWKNYMRRQTNTINYSSDLPLAQGIQFGIDEESKS
jgi:aldehyde dehydrogenase (NAD+)